MDQKNQLFDRRRLLIKSLSERKSKLTTNDIIDLDSPLPEISDSHSKKIDRLAEAIRQARRKNAPVVLMYGAHLFRNGLSPFIINLIEAGLVQHIVTNGAGVIHDWEMAFHSKTTEEVFDYLKIGQFGIWEETGFYQNLAILLGASQDQGYGESIGAMIADDLLIIPELKDLKEEIRLCLAEKVQSNTVAMKLVLLQAIEEFGLNPGEIEIEHPDKEFSIVCSAYLNRVPFSVCPGIGYDIIYSHPINSGAAVGECALRDFLSLTQTLSGLQHGVILSVGSAVMSAQITEKALSMARNVALQHADQINDFYIVVNDIQPGNWDWGRSEPPKDHPAYYLRFCKSFSRLGGHFDYIDTDNRVFIQHLHDRLLN
jgi:deoxyhypusine synthase